MALALLDISARVPRAPAVQNLNLALGLDEAGAWPRAAAPRARRMEIRSRK